MQAALSALYKVRLASIQERLSSLRGDVRLECELGVQRAQELQALDHLLRSWSSVTKMQSPNPGFSQNGSKPSAREIDSKGPFL